MTSVPRRSNVSDGTMHERLAEGPTRGPESCQWGARHLPVVVFTRRARDLFRQRFWVRCWECSLRLGPFATRASADARRATIEAGPW